MTKQVYVSTVPFATVSPEPLERLLDAGFEVEVNPFDRKMTPDEMMAVLPNIDYLVAGIEILNDDVLDTAPRLKVISRVGIGLDALDLEACRRREIRVCYTPDAPTVAVAELNIGMALDALRRISATSARLHRGEWLAHMGGLLRGRTIGFLGFGRIGKTTAQLLSGFRCRKIAVDPVWDIATARALNTTRVGYDTLYSESDIVFVCVPLEEQTRGMVAWPQFQQMKRDAVLINTARGGIVDETDLARALTEGQIAYACLDAYGVEPYAGPLADQENITLTAHMGAAASECRVQMELGAVEEILRFDRGEPLKEPVT